ncbi:MAG: hypothetical protein CSA21_04610 [Deltaproteobacteria bacterium]|nr:MAG: hypothetical protein CSA21_04610 [Deltaproteobacteria bacterium]
MKPILVIQMQRMGDLIMTFPLLLWLSRRFPGQEIVVVAEPGFYNTLAPLGPGVTYVSASQSKAILEREYSLVINVSHRREGALLAGKVKADETIGPYVDQDDNLYIRGNWHVYRASLVDCNRHNTFHWAELNALDVIAPDEIRATTWPIPRELPGHNPKVGLFLGASQAAKRPQTLFWRDVAQGLLDRGMRPILLGGPEERALGDAVQKGLELPVLHLAGTTSLDQLARIGQTLQLMVTPDTGPMHLAAWTGLRVLNLSMGPVNPWETGPYHPGHYILRTTISCSGCWSCRFEEPRCRGRFNARKVVRLVDEVIHHREHNLHKMTFPGLELMRSSRSQGLYWLNRIGSPRRHPSCRQVLDQWWHGIWQWHFGLCHAEQAQNAAALLRATFPDLAAIMRTRLLGHCRRLVSRRGADPLIYHDLFDGQEIPALAPCVRFARLTLENSNFSRTSRLAVLALFERILSLFD